ncbi:kinase-like domain-containing protein [Leptodontidium sp. 2 PMI_412]|nr:kinase-like domain-containing protein [Leptodontidium sp. 2 PMI_412]
MDKLKARLVSIGVENYESKWYIPAQELEKLLDLESVREAVVESKLEPYKQDEVIRTIFQGGKKVFAVSIQIGEVSSFIRFMEQDHLQNQPLDPKLPFTRPALVSILGQSQGELFYRTQWTVLAPFFRGDLSYRNFDKATILPFTRNTKIGSGGFGTVYEIVLDSRHQEDTIGVGIPADSRLIRKELDVSSALQGLEVTGIDNHDSPGREGHVLSLLRLARHPNIVRLIASYSYRDTYNLLFNRAESDLGALLSRVQRPPAFQSDESFYQAMQGLCSALACFHHLTCPGYGLELKGYHHDLKPENILVDGSRFLLSDFGLSSLKDINANSKTLSKDIIGYYLSPERETIEDGFKRKMIGQPSDIWALGCILAVVLTYIQRGQEGVMENPAVDIWLTGLEHNASEEALGLVHLIRDTLKINPLDRPDAATVSSTMDFLAAKSIYSSIMRTFDRITETSHDPLITRDLEIVAPPSNLGFVPSLILKQIRGGIDRLWDTISPTIKSRLQHTLEARLVSTADLDLLNAVHSRFKNDQDYKNIGVAAAIRSMIILADNTEVRHPEFRVDPTSVNTIGPDITPFSSLAKAKDDNQSEKEVLVEWLDVPSFFGLVFDLPTFHQDQKSPSLRHRPIALADLIEDTRNRRMRPDLGAKFRLAESLAAAVLDWHKVGWVHRGISAFSIIFFGTTPESWLESVEEPFFLGFQYSRPNEPNTFTLGPPENPELLDYCHPTYLKGATRHLPEFDYYSLGLVLLEIGYWKRVKSIVSNFDDEDQSPEKLREWLLGNPVEELHMVMGRVYQEAVRTCLTFQSKSSLDQKCLVPVDVQEEFEEKVLAKLRICRA